MKNAYEIRGDHVAIFMPRRDGSIPEALIDLTDLPIAEAVSTSWCPHYPSKEDGPYVTTQLTRKGRNTRLYLHRCIMQPPKGLVTDHINHDGFDNRRRNLRVVTQTVNNLNVLGPRRDNYSCGIRGVTWDGVEKRWQANVWIGGKRAWQGYFRNVEDAGRAVAQARQELIEVPGC